MPVARRGIAPDRLDGAVGGQELLHVPRGCEVALGDDGAGARSDEPRGVVVDSLDGLVERPFGQPGLGVPAGVAQVVEQDDGVGCELDLVERLLPEVLVRRVVHAGDRVQSEAVLGDRVERVAVPGRPAVAVAEVDDDRRAVDGVRDPGPRGVRRVHLDDVGGVAAGHPGGVLGHRAVAVGDARHGPHDDGDLGRAAGLERLPRDGRSTRGGSRQRRAQHRDDERDERCHQQPLQAVPLQGMARPVSTDMPTLPHPHQPIVIGAWLSRSIR